MSGNPWTADALHDFVNTLMAVHISLNDLALMLLMIFFEEPDGTNQENTQVV
jgi:hypothetical protein